MAEWRIGTPDNQFCVSLTRKSALVPHPHHMLHLAEHAAHLGGVGQLHGAVHLVEPQPDQRLALVGRAADRGSGLGQLDRRHILYSVTSSASADASAPLRPSRRAIRSATLRPRRWATDLGLVCSFNASNVARTML